MAMQDQWSGFDIRAPSGRGLFKRMPNSKLHWKPIFASGPMIPTFAKMAAAKGCECWHRTGFSSDIAASYCSAMIRRFGQLKT
jgi:hypothetical protein